MTLFLAKKSSLEKVMCICINIRYNEILITPLHDSVTSAQVT